MTESARGRTRFDWKAGLGIALSIGLLYFALRDVEFHEVVEGIRQADPILFLASITAATLMFVARAFRWKPLIERVRAGTSFRSRFAATTIGFMANNLLPARIGEFVRAYSLARLERLSVSSSLGSLVVERLLDAFTVVGFLFLAMALPGFPAARTVGGRDLGGSAMVLLAVFVAAGVVLFLLALFPRRALRLFDATLARVLPESVGRRVRDVVQALLAGLGTLRDPGRLIRAGLWSLAVWLIGAAAFWLGFRAFGLQVPVSGALFLQSLITLAVALPAAPGFFGVYEAGARIGLVQIWGVAPGPAMSFAVGYHIGSFIPVTVIGLYYAWRLGISWRRVEASKAVVERAVEAESSDAPPSRREPTMDEREDGIR